MPETQQESELDQRLAIPPEVWQQVGDEVAHRMSLAAACTVGGENNRNRAINSCLHLSSAVVLRPDNAENLAALLEQVRQTDVLKQLDATTVATVATLHRLLNIASQEQGGTEITRQIRTLFDELDWLIGKDGMQAVGIPVQEQVAA